MYVQWQRHIAVPFIIWEKPRLTIKNCRNEMTYNRWDALLTIPFFLFFFVNKKASVKVNMSISIRILKSDTIYFQIIKTLVFISCSKKVKRLYKLCRKLHETHWFNGKKHKEIIIWLHKWDNSGVYGTDITNLLMNK